LYSVILRPHFSPVFSVFAARGKSPIALDRLVLDRRVGCSAALPAPMATRGRNTNKPSRAMPSTYNNQKVTGDWC
jgi:hypothetical protein